MRGRGETIPFVKDIFKSPSPNEIQLFEEIHSIVHPNKIRPIKQAIQAFGNWRFTGSAKQIKLVGRKLSNGPCGRWLHKIQVQRRPGRAGLCLEILSGNACKISGNRVE